MGTKEYEAISSRIHNYLNQETGVKIRRNLPPGEELTKSNGIEARISAVFVDIRNSTELFADADRDMVSRMVRSFVSEVVRILKTDSCYEIGVRGDCAYGVYSTRTDPAIYDVYLIAAKVNTLIKLLNKQYSDVGYPEIKVGIGLATNVDRVVKVGAKGTGVSELVWVGEAVPMASNLSGYGCKNNVGPIVMTKKFYDAISKQFQKNHVDKGWFTKIKKGGDDLYHCSTVIIEFDEWIDKY